MSKVKLYYNENKKRTTILLGTAGRGGEVTGIYLHNCHHSSYINNKFFDGVVKIKTNDTYSKDKNFVVRVKDLLFFHEKYCNKVSYVPVKLNYDIDKVPIISYDVFLDYVLSHTIKREVIELKNK